MKPGLFSKLVSWTKYLKQFMYLKEFFFLIFSYSIREDDVAF